ncbi:restriction endonuclease subunit S [Klebsiella michiganensis]|uniref:restriction endonuclease subunit S n=1 Tax=Klebsiella michiganensis TaxID=1134687 RepID=UPI0018D42A70|nr:restriction endonuclease subunit S [Klebsiella michiganensis]QPQ10604.1 restriction endonuclease subunit S [Klebsiella michiganensis]UPI86803.1 restriction endonuclease subunit S [Klebsiella michiganensis]WLP17551.1 restriction endonuclease subunit S [Klebsiella michiganensis]HDX8824357.1 restriction endonuclease subunit S [Klebsiella michiganensis]
MAKYKAYPEYKDSGVEWVDSIPSYWDVKPTFALCDASTQKNIDGAESNVLSLSYGNIISRDVETNFGLLPESFNTYQLINCGDVILRLTDLQNDKNSLRVGLAKQKGIITSAYLKLKANSNINPKFLYRLLHSYDTTKVFYGMGGGLRQSMKFEDFRRLPLLLPPYEEQVKISAFLDHETAKIDNLIEKQKQLIELLKEKRQAVISHAVTKGLNPDVPMKDSGVEWLGEVPEHWEVSKFGYISLVVRGGSPRPAGDPTLFNGDYSPWVTVAEITKDNEIYLDSTDTFLTKKGSEQCRVFKAGTLLLSNSGATLGVPKILSIDANANDGVVGFELLNIDHEYAYFYLSTLTTNLRESIKQGSGQPNLNTDIVKSIAIPIPPEYEIQRIVSFIKETIKLYSSIESGAMEQVKLLQERRTALISAAVTGKIDVRDWVAPDTQDIEEPQEATA